MNPYSRDIEFDPELRRGAFNAVKVCLQVQPDERLTLITDEATLEIAAALVSEIEKTGSPYNVFVLEDFMTRPSTHMPPVIIGRFTKVPGEYTGRRDPNRRVAQPQRDDQHREPE